MKKLLALFVVVLGFSAVSFALSPVDATATASATIITPNSIAKTIDLNFGNIVNSGGGSVELKADNTRTPSGSVSLPAFTGTVSAAKFIVTGESGTTYTISMPASVELSNGANKMTVGTFTKTATAGTLGTLTGTLGASTTQEIVLGATITVGATQATGVYTNATDLTLTVNYN